MDHTQYLIQGSVTNRITRMFCLTHQFEYFFLGHGYINIDYIAARHHDPAGHQIVKFKYRIDQPIFNRS